MHVGRQKERLRRCANIVTSSDRFSWYQTLEQVFFRWDGAKGKWLDFRFGLLTVHIPIRQLACFQHTFSTCVWIGFSDVKDLHGDYV